MEKNSLRTFIAEIPKAELHLHIEGTFEPELLFTIAQRNGIKLKYQNVEELKAAYRFNNLQEFLDIYYEGAQVLLHEEDFYELAMAYFERCHQQNIVHAEIFFDPQTHTHRRVAFETVVKGLKKACDEANSRWNISTKLIPNFLRHLSEEDGIKTFKEALRFGDWFEAFGLDSSEIGHPPAKFKRLFEHVRAEGFKTVAHAGEEGPAQNISDSIDMLQVSRIDHGVRAIDNMELVKQLAQLQIPLTVCPLSNLKLKVVTELEQLPIPSFLREQVVVTLNSDDPAYFGGYLNENYLAVADAFSLTKEDITLLATNSFRASFLPDSEKIKWMDKVANFQEVVVTNNGH